MSNSTKPKEDTFIPLHYQLEKQREDAVSRQLRPRKGKPVTNPKNVPEPLTFARVHEVNRERCNEWHDGFPNNTDGWTGADWSNAMQGESGEFGNVVKKLRRLEFGLRGSKGEDKDRDVLLAKLAKEAADTFLYLDLTCTFYGVNLAEAIIQKFNQVSEEQNLPQRL